MNSNNTHFNLLASFAYLYKNKDFTESFFATHRNKTANVMVDSGAYTKHNAKENRDWLTLDNYCKFLEKFESDCEKYVQLDVIGDLIHTRENYESMVSRNLAPMYVLTMYDKDYDYLRGTMDVNPNCCVAGGTMTKGPWLIKRFQDVMHHTNRRAKIHGLGYVTFPNIIRAPVQSGDSSSWIQQPQVYGILNAFTKNGLCQQEYKKVWSGQQKLKPALIALLNRLEVTPTEFMKREHQHGETSICTLMSIVAYIEYQRYVHQYGKELFLAVGSKRHLDLLCWVNDNLKNCTYQSFLKEFKKV